jgi:ribosomal protein L29
MAKKQIETQAVDIQNEVAELKRQINELKLKVLTREETNTSKLRQILKQIAQILTKQNQNK